MSKITLYHGSNSVIEKPDFNFNNPNNDYGRGFYCTESLDLAKGWAVDENKDGYANIYRLDMDGLKVLDLSETKYSLLHWITLLVTYRKKEGIDDKTVVRGKDKDTESEKDKEAKVKINKNKEWLKANFFLPADEYDIIKGYRADDNYFLIAEDFLRSALTVQGLARALKAGDWGEQIVLKSKEAFSRIRFIGCSSASYKKYYLKRCCRNQEALDKYEAILDDYHAGDITLNQIVAGEVSKDDPRLYFRDDSQWTK